MKKHLLLLLTTLLGAVQTVGAQEIYAAVNNKTATIYYDNQKAARNGEDMGFGNMYGTFTDVTKVVFDASVKNYRPGSLRTWFQNWTSLTTIEHLDYLNTEEVTTMFCMFHSCTALTSLDLTSFDTEQVTDMEGMFAYCSSLTSVDLSSFKTAQVTNMDGMFAECEKLKTIYADESRWSTAGLTSHEDHTHTINDNGMFIECTAPLTGGNGTSYWTTNEATDATYARIDKAGQPGYLTHKAGPAEPDPEPYAVLSNDNTVLTFYYDSKKSKRNGMGVGPFSASDNNIRVNVSSGWDAQRESITSVVFDNSFANCTTLTSTDYWFYGFKNLSSITDINNLKTDNVISMRYMFYNCSGLKSLDVTGFNTQNVTDMAGMFWQCSGLKSLDVTRFKTDKVTNMSLMFENCSGLTNLDVTGFNTQNVTSMIAMFMGCSSLTSLDVTGFKTDKVTDMRSMFYFCKGLTSLDVSKFNTAKVGDMGSMFFYCSGLTSLDVTGFNTDNMRRMSEMFSGCSSLKSLDLSNFNTKKVGYMAEMFRGCSNLTTIFVGSNWSTEAVTESTRMFQGCSNLKGGAGTTYDANHIDKAYAHIDGGTSNPGYFTQKGGPVTGSCDMSEVPTDNAFYAATSFLCERGILDGSKVDGKYLVEKELLRQHLANITFRGLFTLKGREIPSTFVSDQYPAIYDDLKSDAPYYQAAKTLLYLDYGDHITPFDRDRDGFFPDNNESRINILKELMEAFNIKPDMEGTDNPFPNEADIAQLSETSPIKMGYVRQAAKLGIITTENEQFRPYKECLRGEAFLMLAHIIQKIEAGEIADPNPQESDFLDPNSGTGTAEPYAVYNNGTLTFYYDGKKTERGGYDVGPFDSNSTRWGGHLSEINKVIFDDSFAECTTLTSTAHWFEDFSGSESISFTGINNLKTDNVTDMSYMFYSCKAKNIDVSGFNTEKVTTMEKMFDDCGATALDVSNFKTGNVTSMRSMFESCSNLTSLDLSNFNTENVTDMSSMFYADGGLENLNISGFKTGNVTTMNSMFAYCKKLEQIDVSHFETSNVQNMMQMFCNCKGLTSIDVSNFNTEKVGVMQSMFNGCSALTQIDVSHFNTSQVKYMNHMFADCKGITSIDVSNFNIANVQEMKSLFSGCSSLTTIYSDATWFCSYSPNMFLDCTSLVGGAGTTYDANHVDVNYARIDGGTDAPGYFTSTSAMPKVCAKPVISMKDGRLVYDCTTEGVTYKSTISKSYNSSSITLKDTYILSVYAIKDGYENSEAATVEIQMRSPGKKGDVDEDGVVDIADAVRIVNYVVGKVDALAPRHEMNLQDPE